MSIFGQLKFADQMNFDAFSRLKVSIPDSQFDFISNYGDNDIYWEHSTVGTGAVTTQVLTSGIRLSTGGTANNAAATRQTKQYMHYFPGRSLNIEQTFVMSAAQTNSLTRIGYFDDANGIFLERNGSAVSIVTRTSTSGSPVDNAVAQASWNVDPFNGSGPSGKTLDLTKTQILFIQMQYLGVGRVQVGFIVDGIEYVAHQFLNANNLAVPYMTSPTCPIRGYVVNTGTAGGVITLDMFCQTVWIGGAGQLVLPFAVSNDIITRATNTTLVPILSIRAGTLLGGTTGGGSYTNRRHMRLQGYSVSVASANHHIELRVNGVLTGASWSPVDPHSVADVDVSATAIAGGISIDEGYLSSGSATRIGLDTQISLDLPLVFSGLLSTQDIVSVCVRTLTSTGNATATLGWTEPV